MHLIFSLFLTISAIASKRLDTQIPTIPCSASSTNKNLEWDKKNISQLEIKVHFIPHTHDDPGWLKTFNEYQQGINMKTHQAGVQQILDTVVDELSKDPKKTFVYVEMAFFMKWWNEQGIQTKETIKKLLKNQQLEFTHGGQCQSDEATPYQEDIIEQMTLGNQFLKMEFDYIPRIAWNIDNFGHSNTQAALLSQMGFTSLVVSRIDFQDKRKREIEKTMELNWDPQQRSGEINSIFLHVTDNHQSPPVGFAFDSNTPLRSDPIVDDNCSELQNLNQKANESLEYYKNLQQIQNKNELFQMYGEDFTFMNAHEYYKNLDKFLKHINKHPEFGLNISYSLPSKYFESIRKNDSFVKEITNKSDDFFPQADNENSQWTGFYTSRTIKKQVVKEYGRFLQIFRTFFSLLQRNESMQTTLENYLKIELLAEKALALNLHHDAITGTEKQNVSENQMSHLVNATDLMNKIFIDELAHISLKAIKESINQTQCKWNLTAKDCQIVYETLNNNDANTIVLLAIYHPTISGKFVIRIKVPNTMITIIDIANNPVSFDLICDNQRDLNDCDLFFISNLKPYSFSFYKIGKKKLNNSYESKVHYISKANIDKIISIKINETSTLEISKNYSYFKIIDHHNSLNRSFGLQQNYYKSFQRSNDDDKSQASGAYIFRPNQSENVQSIEYSTIKNLSFFNGKILTQINLYGTNTTTCLRFQKNIEYQSNSIEIETYIFPIELNTSQEKQPTGKEITMNIQTTLNNLKTFYTDSNGLELQKRVINKRKTWTLEVSEPVTANYYPINSMIFIEDFKTKKGIFVLNDRSQGGTSLKEGEIEIMINRITAQDDDRGVGEPLNETEGIKMRHHLVFCENGQLNENDARKIQFFNDNRDLLFFATSEKTEFIATTSDLERQLQNDFPQEILLKTSLKILTKKSFLLRTSSLDSFNEKTINFDFKKYQITEYSLTCTETKEEMLQKKNMKSPLKINYLSNAQICKSKSTCTIRPLQIKAFLVKYID